MANEEQEAISLVRDKVINNARYLASKGCYVDDDITDVELIENEE